MTLQKPCVLVVDDDPSTLATYSRILRLEGYEATTACDGAEGLHRIRTESFDLVLTDHRMPHLTGLELLAEAAALRNGPPIAMYTALGSPALEAAARQLGAIDYADGLFDVEGLVRIVKRHLTQSGVDTIVSPVDPRVGRALKFIRRAYRSRMLSLERTAHVAGVSLSYLDRLLQQQTGRTFIEHRRQRRIAVARRLLVERPLLEKQIAAAVGYITKTGLPNERQMRRDFRRALGVAPNAYRRAWSRFDRK